MKITHMGKGLISLLILLAATGCTALETGQVISPGDHIKTSYTCKTGNGEVITTTDTDVYTNGGILKSRVMTTHPALKPVTLIAGDDAKLNIITDLKPMEPEILRQIGQQLPGKNIGRTYDMTVESQVPKGIKNTIRFVSIPRTRKVPKVRTSSVYAFKKALKKEPVAGDILKITNTEGKPVGGYIKVLKVSGKTVEYEAFDMDQKTYETQWGTGKAKIISENGAQWIQTRIDSTPGTLVRMGGVIGKIVKVTDQVIIVDYGHPFAGECLKCTVTLLEKEPNQPKIKKQEAAQ